MLGFGENDLRGSLHTVLLVPTVAVENATGGVAVSFMESLVAVC